MFALFRPAIVSFLLLTVITGVVYPIVVTGVSLTALNNAATGSVIEEDGRAVGSKLIGQPFTEAKYFWPRPSATSPVPYAGAAGSGSNQGPTNPALADAKQQRADALRGADSTNDGPIPIDLLTASASGLDPHISSEAARFQVVRVARARGAEARRVQALVDRYTEARTFGVLGEPRVNVLLLNLALDRELHR
jgi:K+-transporting ATPase ATPase C chain